MVGAISSTIGIQTTVLVPTATITGMTVGYASIASETPAFSSDIAGGQFGLAPVSVLTIDSNITAFTANTGDMRGSIAVLSSNITGVAAISAGIVPTSTLLIGGALSGVRGLNGEMAGASILLFMRSTGMNGSAAAVSVSMPAMLSGMKGGSGNTATIRAYRPSRITCAMTARRAA